MRRRRVALVDWEVEVQFAEAVLGGEVAECELIEQRTERCVQRSNEACRHLVGIDAEAIALSVAGDKRQHVGVEAA